jgi:HSP20 family protein
MIRYYSDLDRAFAMFAHAGSLFPSFALERSASSTSSSSSSPPSAQAIDQAKDQKPMTLEVEVPGFAEKDLRIRVEKRQLLVEGEVFAPTPEGAPLDTKGEVLRRVRRSFELPFEVDAEASTAVVKDGLLSLTLAKHSKDLPKEISVRAA